MTSKILPIVLTTILFAACNQNNFIKTTGHIFERKQLEDGKLMICYAFNNGKAIIQDSSIIENLIIPQDSIAVVFQKNNPANSNLLLQPGR